ncbi:MAG: ABC transporter permease [Crocinitomicaceae bacterium]|nr:ABC transporter permease [Crocinitomicaceae bacterium]
MKNTLLIAMREFKERIGARSFILFSVLGPLLVLGLVYALFALGGQTKQHWNVLIADHGGLFENKIMAGEDKSVTYFFADGVIELDEFKDAKKYQKFDAMLEVNEKVLTNKTGFLFYRNKPSTRMQTRVQYHYERRLEEVLVERFTDMTLTKFRSIKQPIGVTFSDINDPDGEANDMTGWAGFFFGALIFLFIFLFGMTILRSVSREKSNRIVEVLLASVSPNQLMMGKIFGIGFAAFVQFFIWILIIGTGLYLMREHLFPDVLDAANMNVKQMILDANDTSYQEQFYAAREYNEFVNLVYDRIQFTNTLIFFFLFFVAGYFFYGAIFAAIGATMGSESDGQQFVIPIVIVLCLSLYAGYYTMNYPDTGMATLLHYIPFTSPVVVMVKLYQGYEPGHMYEIYLALIILIISAFVVLAIASRLYRNGILQFGHRVRLKHIFKWMKSS